MNQLKEELSQYQSNDQMYLTGCQEADNKYNNLANAYKIKEQEYAENIQALKIINQKLEHENDILK